MINTIEKHPVLSLTIVVLLMLLVHLDVPNITIMEARNFITAREMIQDNNWILTTMNGEPRYQKPPLPTWLTAISGLIFGVNSLFALRVPAALMVLFSGIFCYYFSLKLTLSKKHSFRNSLILVTSFYVIGIINEAPWDIFAHGFMLAGLYYLYSFFEENKSPWKKVLLASIFFGFSILSKGPVSLFALFIPLLISYSIVFKFKNFKQKLVPFLSFILLFIIIGSWWFVYVRLVDSDSFLAIAERETGNWSSYNVKPFYYYWSFFTQSGLWTIPAFIGLLYPYLIKRVENKKGYKFTFLWAILAVVLLSIIPEKKARYLMPVLIPLALNTGFYIQYLIKSFSNLKDKKETIPVYFNFGLIAGFGLAVPFVLYFILKENIQLYLFNYISTSIVLVVIGLFIFKNLIQKKIKQVFYLTILFMVSLLIFGMPISKYFNKNEDYNSMKSLHKIEDKNNISTYTIGAVTPEMLWDYNGKIPNVFKNETLILPKENEFGLLLPVENNSKILEKLNKNHHLKFIKTYNLNVGSKQKDRLIRQFYLISKK